MTTKTKSKQPKTAQQKLTDIKRVFSVQKEAKALGMPISTAAAYKAIEGML
jgi:hypothetical protein